MLPAAQPPSPTAWSNGLQPQAPGTMPRSENPGSRIVVVPPHEDLGWGVGPPQKLPLRIPRPSTFFTAAPPPMAPHAEHHPTIMVGGVGGAHSTHLLLGPPGSQFLAGGGAPLPATTTTTTAATKAAVAIHGAAVQDPSQAPRSYEASYCPILPSPVQGPAAPSNRAMISTEVAPLHNSFIRYAAVIRTYIRDLTTGAPSATTPGKGCLLALIDAGPDVPVVWSATHAYPAGLAKQFGPHLLPISFEVAARLDLTLGLCVSFHQHPATGALLENSVTIVGARDLPPLHPPASIDNHLPPPKQQPGAALFHALRAPCCGVVSQDVSAHGTAQVREIMLEYPLAGGALPVPCRWGRLLSWCPFLTPGQRVAVGTLVFFVTVPRVYCTGTASQQHGNDAVSAAFAAATGEGNNNTVVVGGALLPSGEPPPSTIFIVLAVRKMFPEPRTAIVFRTGGKFTLLDDAVDGTRLHCPNEDTDLTARMVFCPSVQLEVKYEPYVNPGLSGPMVRGRFLQAVRQTPVPLPSVQHAAELARYAGIQRPPPPPTGSSAHPASRHEDVDRCVVFPAMEQHPWRATTTNLRPATTSPTPPAVPTTGWEPPGLVSDASSSVRHSAKGDPSCADSGPVPTTSASSSASSSVVLVSASPPRRIIPPVLSAPHAAVGPAASCHQNAVAAGTCAEGTEVTSALHLDSLTEASPPGTRRGQPAAPTPMLPAFSSFFDLPQHAMFRGYRAALSAAAVVDAGQALWLAQHSDEPACRDVWAQVGMPVAARLYFTACLAKHCHGNAAATACEGDLVGC